MPKLTQEQIEFLTNTPFMIFSTADNNQPRTAIVLPSRVLPEKIIISDVSMEKSNQNVQNNSKVFISSYDKELHKWIKITGNAIYEQEGALFNKIKAFELTRGVTPKGIIVVDMLSIEDGIEE